MIGLSHIDSPWDVLVVSVEGEVLVVTVLQLRDVVGSNVELNFAIDISIIIINNNYIIMVLPFVRSVVPFSLK